MLMNNHNRIAATILGVSLFAAASALAAPVIEKGPYLQQVDTSGVIICWVTNFDAPSSVEYGTTGRLGQTASEQKPQEVWSVGGESQLVAFHQVPLTGLRANTKYFYRVRTGSLSSEISSFTTAVRPGEPFSFVVFGDTRPTDNHRAVINRVLSLQPEPRFTVHTGDLVSDGQRWPDWQGFFDVEGPMLRKIPFCPVLGNHEHNAENYFSLFNLPGNEHAYSFTYGDAHVVVLDSDPPYRNTMRQWLIQDLRTHWDSPYTFVAFHHPPYSCTNDLGRRIEGLDIVRECGSVFEAYGVTAVFNGHDHNYQHNLVNGIHYVVTGGGGASLYPVRPREFTVKTASIYHVVQVNIGPQEAAFTVIKADNGAVVETFAVPRRQTAPLEYTE